MKAHHGSESAPVARRASWFERPGWLNRILAATSGWVGITIGLCVVLVVVMTSIAAHRRAVAPSEGPRRFIELRETRIVASPSPQ